jgi:hypothetical protein
VIIAWLILSAVNQCESSNNIERELRYIKWEKPIEKIAELYIEQLKTIFDYVTEKPLVLYNTRNTPIFHFACASNNQTAIKIASQIIKKKQGL